jgi:hypothetical protein
MQHRQRQQEFRKTVASALPSRSVETYPSKGDRLDTRTSETLQPPLWRQPRAILNERKRFPSIWVAESNPRLLQLLLVTSGLHPSAVGAGFEQARQQKEGSYWRQVPEDMHGTVSIKTQFYGQCKNKSRTQQNEQEAVRKLWKTECSFLGFKVSNHTSHFFTPSIPAFSHMTLHLPKPS